MDDLEYAVRHKSDSDLITTHSRSILDASWLRQMLDKAVSKDAKDHFRHALSKEMSFLAILTHEIDRRGLAAEDEE